MQIIIAFTLLACVAATPLYLTNEVSPLKSTLTSSSHAIDHGSTHVLHSVHPVYSVHEVHAPSKTTVTKNSLSISHGGHELVHAVPVVHTAPVVHSLPLVHASPVYKVSTPVHSVATSSQSFKLDSYSGSPVVQSYHTVPSITQVHEVHALPVVHSSPVYYKPGGRSGDSAVSQQSSTVHKTEHLVHSVPLYSLHH